MAKGQIHLGKRGPEKCGVDESKPNSRGCPYGATGHYESESEALEQYAVLNRVDPGEVKALVKDGASPKDAVGLVRSGFGTDYLYATSRTKDVPSREREDATDAYLDAKQSVEADLRSKLSEDAKEDISVTVSGTARNPSVLIESTGKEHAGRFRYSVVERGGRLQLRDEMNGYNRRDTHASRSIFEHIDGQIKGDSELSENFGRMLSASNTMLSYEESEKNEKAAR